MQKTFVRLMLDHAQQRPDAPALREKVYGIWQTTTWAELALLVRRLACGLAEAGVRRDDHLIVVGENRPRLYATMLAAQALGAVPVPLYQDAAATEYSFPINNADVAWAVVEDQEQVDKLLELRAQCPSLQRIWFDDPRGLRNYAEDGLAPIDALVAAGQAHDAAHPGFFDAEVARCQPDDVAAMFFTSGTTGNPKGVVHSHATLLDRASAGQRFDKLTAQEEVLAYMPLAWIGQNIFSYAQWLACGYVVNCPESAATVMIDLKEIGPTYYFAPPRVFEGLLTSVMIRMEDAGRFKRWLFHRCMDVARRVGPAKMDGKPLGLLDTLAYALGNVLVYGPLRNTLGFSRVRVAYTAGEAIGPDLFTFYRSIGINLKQLYGSTETAVFVCLQPDHEVKADTVGVPIDGVEIRVAENGEILVKSPGLLKEYYKNPAATAEVLTADGWYHTGDAGFLDATGHLKIIDRAKDVGRLSGNAKDGGTGGALFAPKYVENKLIRRPARKGLRLRQHRLRSRRQLGRAPQPALCRLHRPGQQDRRAGAGERLRREGQRRPRHGCHAGGKPDQPLPRAAQGTRRRRRRTDAHAQGAPRHHRRQVPGAGGCAVQRQDRAVHRDRGEVRGRPQRQRQRHAAHRRRQDLSCREPGRVMSTRKNGEVILDVQNISLRFGGVKALSDISFNVREHELRAIIGPNGAGKSSMLNCINGVYTPQEGSITFRGQKFSHMNSRQVAEMGVARTFQNLALFKGMSVLDNIMSGRNLKMKTNLFQQAIRFGAAEREESEHREFVEKIIDFLEIQAYRKTPVGRLPYGLQKRVDLGRALAMEPQVLLLDEPMAGMNVEEKQDMSRFILDVNDEYGTTIVLIEHDMGVVMDISDRVVVLDYGKKIGDGTPDEVRANPDVISAYLGTSH